MDFFLMNSTLVKSLIGKTAGPSAVFIRPAQKNDVDLILDMHQRLSGDSLYNRYHIERKPSRQEIEQILALESGNGRVLVAAVPGVETKIVGLAYYVVTGETTAEIALLVEDLYQGQGIGRRLMQALTRTATTLDICFFDARVLPSNKPMIHLLYKSGELVSNEMDYGTLEMRMDICSVSE